MTIKIVGTRAKVCKHPIIYLKCTRNIYSNKGIGTNLGVDQVFLYENKNSLEVYLN